jgi:hypothetical protein
MEFTAQKIRDKPAQIQESAPPSDVLNSDIQL